MSTSEVIEDLVSSALMDLHALERQDPDVFDVWRHKREVGNAVGELCELLESLESRALRDVAERAYRVVRLLAVELDDVDSDNRYTRNKLDLTRDAVAELMAAIEPLTRR
jgi:hypothetical protein